MADIEATVDPDTVTRDAVDANIVRCPDAGDRRAHDRAHRRGAEGGRLAGRRRRGGGARRAAGLGEPVFDKLEADLAKAMLSLPAAKGFEIGSGFAGTLLTGSAAQRSVLRRAAARVRTRTNRSGGVQGGISNGEDILVRVAFKPTATILREQETVDEDGHDTTHQGARPSRSVRAAARGPDRRGDAGAGARRSFSAAARPVRLARRAARGHSDRRGRRLQGPRPLLRLSVADGSTAAAPVQTEEPRQVHFTFTAPDAVTFNWRGSDSTLRFWAKNVPPRTVRGAPARSRAVRLRRGRGRKPSRTGCGRDRIPIRGRPSRRARLTQSFRAPAAPGAVGFTFVAVGDIGAAAAGPRPAIVNRAIARGDPTLVLGLGDLTYGGRAIASATSVATSTT